MLLSVNKTDRAGARYEQVLRQIREKLTPAAVPMGRVRELGTAAAEFVPYARGVTGAGHGGPGHGGAVHVPRLAELLAEHDDELLAAYVEDDRALTPVRLRRELRRQSRSGLVHPVFFGSAVTGAGIAALVDGLTELLPAGEGDPEGPVHGLVFKVERTPDGQKTAYARMFSGTVRVRDKLLHGADGEGKVTGIDVFEQGAGMPGAQVSAGRIGRLRGLAGVRIGDALCADGDERPLATRQHHFAPPTLETVVTPCRAEERGALHTALTLLAEQDPLIGLRQDPLRGELHVSLYGEVQKEVVQATLADEFGIDVTFRESTVICVERLDGTGEAAEIMHAESNPFLATVGLRVEPAPAGSGVAYRLEVELGSMPYAFMRAVEETVRGTLRQGLYGWEIPDCTVTMTCSGYAPRQSHSHAIFDKSMSSTGADFRQLTPLVLLDALKRAGTTVHEPVHDFRLEIPAETFGAVLPVLSRLGAVPQAPAMRKDAYVLEGEIPAAAVHDLERRLPTLTSGEGVLECVFARYRPVTGRAPSRPRTDHDPLNRKEYLLRVVRRVAGA